MSQRGFIYPNRRGSPTRIRDLTVTFAIITRSRNWLFRPFFRLPISGQLLQGFALTGDHHDFHVHDRQPRRRSPVPVRCHPVAQNLHTPLRRAFSLPFVLTQRDALGSMYPTPTPDYHGERSAGSLKLTRLSILHHGRRPPRHACSNAPHVAKVRLLVMESCLQNDEVLAVNEVNQPVFFADPP